MNKKQFAVFLFCTVIFAFLGGMFSGGFFPGTRAAAQTTQTTQTGTGEKVEKIAGLREYLLAENVFIGIVEKGKFKLLAPRQSSLTGVVRLTGIQMQEARPPDSAELNLEEYDGKALMICGHNGGGWIYRAAVVDSGGPLVTVLVKQVFGQ